MSSLIQIKKDFHRLFEQGTLGGSYLIFGESLEAAERLIADFARFLEFDRDMKEETPLSDALFAKGGETGIDEIREFILRLQQAPMRASRRVFAIFEADRLTLPAQHAILKLSEEPPALALVMLTVRNPEVLLAPLASRFQKIFLKEPGKEEASESDLKTAAKQLLVAKDSKSRNEILKKLVEDEADFRELIKELLVVLKKDPLRNAKLLKSLLRRLSVISQFNVNKKLQIEAAFLDAATSH